MGEAAKTTDENTYELFDQLRLQPDRPAPQRKVAIFATPRCGSSFFCKSLASTGKFGAPSEWLNVRFLQAYARVFGLQKLDLRQYLRFIMAKTTTDNGVFSIKIHVEQYNHWHRKGFDILKLGFDRVYAVHRRDKLAQALSLAKAKATDQWTSKSRPVQDVTVDQLHNSHVIRALHQLSMQDEYFAARLAPHVHRSYCYEDYSASDAFFHEVLDDCGIAPEAGQTFSCDLQIQRGDKDAEKLRSLAEYLGCRHP